MVRLFGGSGLAFLVALGWAGGAGDGGEALAQNGAGPTPGVEEAGAGEAEGERRISFSFKDAPIDRVIDFFALEAGVPVIEEADIPAGTVTFVSDREFGFEEALRVLNTILRTRGLLLRFEDSFLYLGKVGDMQKAAVPTFSGALPEGVSDEQIVTVVIPLSNASATPVAQNLSPLVASYGSIVAMPNQNMLVVTESAGQVRRLRTIIASLDEQPPFEESVEVFKLEHVKASEALESLKVLVAEKQVTVVFDQQGNRQVVQDENIAGVRLEADDRTNSVIALGTEARLRTVAQLVEVIDSPDAGRAASREMVTFALVSSDAERVAGSLGELFKGLPEDERPTVLPLPDLGKVTVVGSSAVLGEAASLVEEIDGSRPDSGERDGDTRETLRNLVLENAEPRGVIDALNRLLSPRQQRVLRYTVLPGTRAVTVLGPARDVQAAASLVSFIDGTPAAGRELRILTLDDGLTGSMLERAIGLVERAEPTLPPIEVVEVDEGGGEGDAAGVATVLGSRESLGALERMVRTLRDAERSPVVTRTFELERGEPAVVARRLASLARPMLIAEGEDAETFDAPQVDAVDELDLIVVRARADQFAVIERLIPVVDERTAVGTELRVVRLRSSDPRGLAERAETLFETLGQNLEPDERGTVSWTFDERTGNLIITADPVGMARFTGLLDQARQLAPPERTTRLIDLERARAGEVLEGLRALLADTPPVDPGREVPAPVFSVVEKTNSILVTAEEVQHRVIRDYVSRLDVAEPTAAQPLRLFQIRSADAAGIAELLRERYAERPQQQRLSRPVDVDSDQATNTLIVAAHPELVPDIEAFVREVNAAASGDADRVTEIFPLKVAKAENLARAMQSLYPEPPMPRDRRGRPMPWLQEPREVNVSADSDSNSLIVDAPAERMPAFTALVDKLDRVELPPRAELRTYAIERADLNAITRTLQNLSRSGSLSAPAQPGQQRVPVTIESEPQSGTLIVGGDETTHEIVERLLQDLAMVPVERELRVVRIENADPRAVAARAQEVYGQQTAEVPGAQPVDVSVDETTNALLVVAEAEAMGRFMGILDQLEEQAGPPRELRLYELEHASADDVVAFMNDLTASSAPFSAGSAVDPVFEPIERNNGLLVAAQADQHAIIESLIRSVDTPDNTDAAPLRILRLRTAEATNIATVLTQAFAGRPAEERAAKPVSIRADAATNTLIVSAHPDVLPEIESIVTDLNDAQAFDSEGREIRIFPLKIARAEELARTLDAMFPAPPVPVDRRGRPMPSLRQPKEVQVRADPQTNSIIVDAPAQRLAGFEQLVNQLDRAEITGDSQLRTYTIARADLDVVRGTLERLARSGGLTPTRTSNTTPVVIEAEPLTSTLIVSAPPEAFENVERILEDLEQSAATASSTLLFFTLERARAARLEPLVSRLLATQYENLSAAGELRRARAESAVEVTADAATNTLILNVPESLAAGAREIIARLDDSASDAGRNVVRVIPLGFASARDAAPALQRTLATADLPSGIAGAVTVEAASSGETSSLIVSGPEKDVDYVEGLVSDLDQPPTEQTLDVRTVYLENNRAETVARVVEEVLSGSDLPWWAELQLRQRGQDTGERMRVRVAAEPRANAVVITAAPQLIAVAEELVKQLDRPLGEAGSERPVRIITLVNADARELSANLGAVFADGATGSAEAPPTIRVDAASNSLIVRASESQIERVEELAGRLDRAAMMSSRQLRSIAVDRSRTDPGELARAIRRLLGEQGVSVEIIDAEELLEDSSSGDGATPSSDAGEGDSDDQRNAAGGILIPERLRFVLHFHQTVIAQTSASTQGEEDSSASVDISSLVKEARALLEAERAGESAAATDAEAVDSTGAVGTEQANDGVESGGVTLAVDAASGRLVVIGSTRAAERVAELAERLQAELPPDPSRIRVVKLPPNADPNVVANLLRATTIQLGRASAENPAGLTARTAVIPDRASRSIVVAANDTDFETLSRVIGALATPAETEELAIRTFPLANVRADLAARSLSQLIEPARRGPTAPRQGDPIELTAEDGEGGTLSATVPLGSVRVVAGPSAASVIIAGPARAFGVLSRLVELVDESPAGDSSLTRLYELENAEAREVSRTLSQIFNANRRRARNLTTPATVLSDDRTNTIIVTADDAQQEQAERLLEELDRSVEDDRHPLRVIPVSSSAPSSLARIIDQAIIGEDRGRSDDVTITADDALNVLLVRAPAETLAEIEGLLGQLDRPDVAELPIRSVKLERADAGLVAAALERFFRDRARAATNPGQRTKQPRVAVAGDQRTGTLLIAASDEDFAEVERLIETFDAPGGTDELEYRIIRLENATATEIIDTVRDLANQLRFSNPVWMRAQSGGRSDQVFIREDARTNSIVVLGSGEFYETIESIVAMLDAPTDEAANSIARVFRVPMGDLRAIRDAANETLGDTDQRWWMPPDPTDVRFTIDESSRSIIAIGPAAKVERAGEFIERLAESLAGPERGVESVNLAFADAGTVADSINRFFGDRARLAGTGTPAVSALGTRGGSTVLLSGAEDDLRLAADVAARFDQPADGEDRSLEIYQLEHADPRDVARAVRELFPRSRATGRQPVVATPDLRTDSLVVSSPAELSAQVEALVKRLDRPAGGETVTLRTFTLETARAEEVARTLRSTLNLDDRGRPIPGPNGEMRRFALPGDDGEAREAVEVRADITPDRRSNTLLVSADAASLAVIEELVSQLDDRPAQAPTEYRIFDLEHAIAGEASITLRALLRARARAAGEPEPSITADRDDNTLIVSATSDQIAEIEEILEDIDQPAARQRETEFVKLEFADATQVRSALGVFYGPFASAADTPGARNVSITADPATNSLVISAEPDEWPGIRNLIEQLDNEEYDPSRRLEVIPLVHADAASVAGAIQSAFDRPLQARIEAQQRRDAENQRRRQNNPFFLDPLPAPDTLIDTEDIVSVSAEPVTNSLIVSAGQRDLERIRAIIETLDKPGFAGLPRPMIIPLAEGRAEDIAGSLRQFYESGARGSASRRAVNIGFAASANALIVRAPEEELAEIRTLAESLQRSSAESGVAVRTLRLEVQPAARLADTLQRTFAAKAQRLGEPLVISADARTNALVITASASLQEEITRIARELDSDGVVGEGVNEGAAADDLPVPGPGQTLTVITLEHVSPAEAVAFVGQLDLGRTPDPSRPGLVSEPVNVVALPSRVAVAIAASPSDLGTIRRLLSTFDRPAATPQQEIAVVRLSTAQASNVAETLRRLLDPNRTDADTALATALAEQVRRLRMRGETAVDADVSLDLTKPVRVDADAQSNSIVVASTPGNVAAIRELIRILDRLPVGDAVVVRLFPLNNSSAERAAGILRELFQQGEALRRAPGTQLRGLPTTETGRALAGEIAVATDPRTNVLIVAGREEAVALAEVLIESLDNEEADNWIEPRLIRLVHADARRLAETINQVIIRGVGTTPESVGLQQQVGRLRVLAQNGALDGMNGSGERMGPELIEADLFAPLTSLIVEPEEQMNALIAIGSTPNLDAIEALVEQLDVEAASRDALVRLYPLKHAAADRVGGILQRLFEQQIDAENLKDRDSLSIESDPRTNTLIVATSPRSFAIVENLLRSLDTSDLNPTVSITVLPVERASASDLAPRIERLMRERLRANAAGEPSPRDVISIQADDASNALIVAASAENLRIIEGLVETLSAGAGGEGSDGSLEVIQLRAADAEEMAQTLEELYAERANETRGSRNEVRIRADERLNAVVVSGTAEDVRELRALVEQLDGQTLSAVREIRIIPLDSANALEMVNLVNSIISGRGNRASESQATLLRFARSIVDGASEMTEAEVSRAIRARVSLEPELRTNSVVVSAPPSLMLLIESLIEELDSSAEGARKIEVFKLDNADADAMREILVELFNLQRQGNLFVLVPAGRDPDDPDADPGDLTFSTVPDERQQLSITVDLRTNSLLVSGSEVYLERVAEVIRQLDQQTGMEREQFTYELKNARVEEVATALQQFISQEQDRIARLLGPDRSGSLQRRLEREISVVGVPGSSRLILSTSPRYMERVRRLIDELDTPPKQVLIQVLIAEVTLDDTDTFGIDASFQGAGSRDYGGQYTALGTPLLTALGVPNLSVTSLDFEVLVRALQVQGRLEVLSRPQILVNDNQLANINVGEEIQLVTNVERLDDGRTVSDVTPRDLGVILVVEPSISPDNTVRLDIAPEISTLTNRTTQVSTDFDAPVISQRSAETTVTVRDGETIVIGGLIESSIDVRTSKVPLLGDIPALGQLFRSRDEENRRTELLILLTPRVIVNPEDLRRYSDEEIDRLTLPAVTKEELRNNDIGIGSTSFANPSADAPAQRDPDDSRDIAPEGRPFRGTEQRSDPENEYEGFELPL